MCGLVGIAATGGRTLPPDTGALVRAMLAEIAHRGPDDVQLHLTPTVALGFCRLSIVDVEGGRQPVFSEDRSVVAIANGEIYNHADLRAQLGGRHQLRSASDCEVLPHLYEDRGIALCDDLIGMYAAALLDQPGKRLHLVRDRFGIKPLFYAVSEGLLLFGSELKALLRHPACPRELDWQAALADPWLGADPATDLSPPGSFFRGIHPLPAAHRLEVDLATGAIAERRYWSMPAAHEAGAGSDRAALVREYGELLADSVERCLMSDVEVGLFLSGGIDSIAIAALAARHQQLHAFTVLSPSTLLNQDARHATMAAERLGLPVHQVLFCWHDRRLGPDEWKRLLWLCETPYCGPEQLYKHELHRHARATRPGLKVMLSGQGSDEFNGGYSTVLGSAGRTGWADFLAAIDALDRRRLIRGPGPGPAAWEGQLERRVFAREFLAAAGDGRAHESPGASGWDHYVRTKMRDLEMYNLWHEDRTAAGLSIENRVPFLDHRLVELTGRVSPALRADLFADKRILREAVRGLLPRALRLRPKVPFFHGDGLRYTNRMMLRLLRAGRKRLAEEAFAPLAGEGRVVDLAALERAIDDATRDPEALNATVLLRLVNLGLLARMARTLDVAVPGRDRPLPAIEPAIEIENWERAEPALWRRLALRRAIEPTDIPSLRPDVAIALRVDRGDAGEVVVLVGDRIEFVLDPEKVAWRRFLCEIDGKRSLAAIARRVGASLAELGKDLEEAIDFGVMSLAPGRARRARAGSRPGPIRRRKAAAR